MMRRRQLPKRLIEKLRTTERVVALTGAGISAESGIPTFREAQTGLWARYDARELATPAAFRENPNLVWDWYEWRRSLVASATPNAGHRALARLELQVAHVVLITQNVDGLHQEAGSTNVIELHGNLRRNKCFSNGHLVDRGEEIAPQTAGDLPRCPHCQSLLRPDVVWFGESLPTVALESAYAATQNCQLFLAIGTSAIVHPASSFPYVAMEAGAMTVEVNPNRTPLTSSVDFSLRYPAGEILPQLLLQAWPGADLSKED